MNLSKAFALRVRQILAEKNITQYKLEQLTGIYHSTMGNILNCVYKTPNFKNMAIIIRELGMTLTEFFDNPLFDLDKIDMD